ncbi:protein phosphatase 1 regulatory subunit 26 isoform X1 [Salmo trutta]|uniref:protein phosphatase 1 regulatory subunit 26 isoform X1 n=1 Tax=Salmo trutta TaxID=8032 RepID=UPI001131F64A|nr:protein phosphatase 1 regulatory subunit 26-like isoform X1 [Salmo trutta]XP_029565757.1 protein phosphatase 1 regulatory subunit 26-like isoform X1 [Salmo trutta]
MLQPPHPPQHHTRMYLNLPPVAALHTEWRSSCGGLPRGFSGLPLCFNDSDSDLSTTGTPISEKVQMIIESLRSTQSSLNMGDETEGNQVLSGQPVQEAGARGSQGQGFKVRRGPPVVMGPKPKFRGPLPLTHTDNLLALPEVSYNVDSESSDGDDSVDRGIEEAIQEYLKEKDDHKRKAEPEPATNILQPPKIPRREAAPTFPEPTKQHSDSNKVLTASNQVPRSVKTETHNTALPMKKCLKSKIPTCKENPFKKLDTISNAAVIKKRSSSEQKRGPSNSNPLSDKRKSPVLKALKLEEHLSDSDSSSSSDDGIEEAIQRYQQEKKKERHEGGRQSSKPLLILKEESDSSSSDDGIEEAIRHYQLEKQKEKGVPKISLFLPKQKQVGKAAAPLHCPESTSTQAAAMKKHKLSKKKKPETRDLKSSLPSQTPGSSLSLIKKRLAASSPKGNGLLLSTKVEPLRERGQEQYTTPFPATLKVNTTTTAELMCAEAILDISKAVIKMPGAFNPNIASAGHININSSSTESTATTSLLISTNCHDDDNNNTSDDESSIDSEDGIEQEIRKFLEEKAQMHKLPPGPGSDVGTTSPGGTNTITEPEKNTKLNPAQKKTLRLSVTQKRKRIEEGGSRRGSKEGESDLKMKEEALPKHLTKYDSRSSVSSLKKAPLKSVRGSERRGEPKSGDKSSSLDSDEDLDTAIKDLLKTKKKLKKKTRDVKLKSRKGLEDEEPLSRKTELKKLGMDHVPKTTSLLKTSLKVTTTTAQSSNNNRKKGTFSKHVSQYPQSNEKKEPLNQTDEMDRSQGNRDVEGLSRETNPVVVQIKEESSSVDSDDSIEQEIRKFLAEKAKVSTTTVKTDDREEIRNGKGKTTVPLTEKCIKLENQLAEIPRIDVTQFPDLPRQSSCEQRGVPDRGIFPNTPPIQPVPGNHTPETASGSCLLSALTPSSYPPVLEPANGTVSGAARSEKRRSSSSDSGSGDTHQSANSEMAMGHSYRSFPSTSYPLPRTDSEQWCKSQVIPTTETKEKIHNRNPFQYSSPSFGEKTATTPAYQCVVPASIYPRRRNIEPAPDTPVSTRPAAVRTGSSIRSPLVPFHRPSSETTSTSTAVFSSPFPSLTRRPTETGPSGRYFLQGHESGSRWGQSPTLTPGLTESSVVHVAKDKTMFVELSTNKTNHVQVRSREVKVSEGKEERRRDLPGGESERERECRKTEERGEEQIGRRGEECVDETDVSESDERSSPEQQGFPTLSLSSSIDPGITLSPYIALNTEERSKRFRWMCKAVAVNQPKKTKFEKPVKRKLQFLPLSRKNKSTGK